ncbi:MAG: cysteine desulfurase [Melioribacteraceae bacterium]|nr:cysteine desulfurase [Melioribacteraceae bacterium]
MKVYLDNAATTSIHPEVIYAMLPYLTDYFGNPSSTHSYGRKVRVAIEDAREKIASIINADPSEIYFTSGGTEADNYVLNGIAKVNFNETKRKKILITKGEHKAVIESADALSRYGYDIEKLELNSDSILEKVTLEKEIDNEASLTSIIFVNNETGAINNIGELTKVISDPDCYFHTDAVQAFGKIEIDVKKLGIDALSTSAHKIGGPKGVGFAYIKNGTPMTSLIIGGGQERNRRGGTENVAGIIGFAKAAEISIKSVNDNYKKVKELKNKFLSNVKAIDSTGIIINGGAKSSPYILSLTLKNEIYNNDSESILMFMDINGVACSSGSACTSGTIKPSHVILASGLNSKDAQGTIRFSFSPGNTFEEIDYASDVLEKMLNKFRKV